METAEILFQLSIYAEANKISNKELAERLHIPYQTVCRWNYFTGGKDARSPSVRHKDMIKAFLENKDRPGVYEMIVESRQRAQKVEGLLISLEEELRWFRDNDPRAREEFRREIDASDIGYISSLLTMLTDEEKFQRWLALTTTRFQSFKKR